jgi:hypothetical protein
MHTFCCNLAALAVASLFYTWRSYHVIARQQERRLRERVCYLLWSVAGQE